MKSTFVLYALSVLPVLSAADLCQAQTADNCPTTSAVRSTGSDISIRQAEQVAATAVDGAATKPEQAFSRTSSTEAFVPDIYKPFKERYYKTVELVQISWPHLIGGTNGKFGGRLALGLNRPHYRLKKELGVYGNLDLNIDGIFDGIINSARITVVYDLRRPYYADDTKVRIFVDRISFKMGIPIGRR
jgi:hypothetical protein